MRGARSEAPVGRPHLLAVFPHLVGNGEATARWGCHIFSAGCPHLVGNLRATLIYAHLLYSFSFGGDIHARSGLGRGGSGPAVAAQFRWRRVVRQAQQQAQKPRPWRGEGSLEVNQKICRGPRPSPDAVVASAPGRACARTTSVKKSVSLPCRGHSSVRVPSTPSTNSFA